MGKFINKFGGRRALINTSKAKVLLMLSIILLSKRFLGGGAVGLVGWGGAQVIIPGMTHSTMGLTQLSATGISLSCLSLSTVSSGFKFARDDAVDMYTSLAIAIPSVVSARLGTHIAKRLSGDALSLIFNGMSIILIPIHFWIQQRAQERRKKSIQVLSKSSDKSAHERYHDGYDSFEYTKAVQHASFGVCSGFVSSLMGVGGLPLTMSYLTEATNLPHHLIQGTAICALVPSIITSALSRIHSIPLGIAGIVAGGAVVGGFTGAQVALNTSEERLRQLYMLSLVVFGGRSVVAASRNIKNIWFK